AITVGAFLDAAERRVDLGHDLALAVAGAQFDRAIGFLACAIGEIGQIARSLLHVFDGAAAFGEDGGLPGKELAPEVLPLARVHERLIFRWTIIVRYRRFSLRETGFGLHIRDSTQLAFLSGSAARPPERCPNGGAAARSLDGPPI